MTYSHPDPSLPEKSLDHSELTIPLYDYSLHLNRKFSWLDLNSPAHKKAHDKTTPLSKKLDCADTSNPDRFFCDHFEGLVQTLNAENNDCDPSGQTFDGQVDMVGDEIGNLFTEQYCCFTDKVLLAARESSEKVR